MKRILITAVNTTADKRLVQQLVAAQFSVRTIAADINAGNPLLQLPVEIFAGDPLNAASLVAATKGCDYVINNSLPQGGHRQQIAEKNYLLKTFKFLETLLCTTVKLVIHLQQVDETSGIFSAHVNENDASEALAVAAPYTMLNTVQQLIVSRRYQSSNNVLLLCAADMSKHHGEKDFDGNNSCPGEVIVSLLQNEHRAQVYIVNTQQNHLIKKPYTLLSQHKLIEFTRIATVFIKTELWRSLLYACF